MPSAVLYDEIGQSYTTTRREDPRIASAIHAALGDARTVLNVGAGTGSYEPRDRRVIAIEPSAVMIASRPPGAARVVRARAEALPFGDSSFDATMAVLSDHHWEERARGLAELRRVARRRVVVFTWDPRFAETFWLTRDYLPGFKRLPGMSIAGIARCLGGARIEPVPIPHDCGDGFFHAFWRRPAAYLDERVRAGASVFARLQERENADMVRRLKSDLETGAWEQRNAELLDLDELDLGYRLLIAESLVGHTPAMAGELAPGSAPLEMPQVQA
jgi:SAM-dependent methyltransferase